MIAEFLGRGKRENSATIWKFPFRINRVVEIQMPGIAHILHVECQQGTPCLWAVVDPSREKVIRRLRLLGTGHPITGELGRHVATFQRGAFVWHMFEEPLPKEVSVAAGELENLVKVGQGA